jgi:metallophosphoesterase superfamily enzyme
MKHQQQPMFTNFQLKISESVKKESIRTIIANGDLKSLIDKQLRERETKT